MAFPATPPPSVPQESPHADPQLPPHVLATYGPHSSPNAPVPLTVTSFTD